MSVRKDNEMSTPDPEIQLISDLYDALCRAGLDTKYTERAVAYALDKYCAEHRDGPKQTEG